PNYLYYVSLFCLLEMKHRVPCKSQELWSDVQNDGQQKYKTNYKVPCPFLISTVYQIFYLSQHVMSIKNWTEKKHLFKWMCDFYPNLDNCVNSVGFKGKTLTFKDRKST